MERLYCQYFTRCWYDGSSGGLYK